MKDQFKNSSTEKKRNKIYGYLILAAIILPMIMAYFVFKTGVGFPTTTTNKGTLIQPPIPLQDLSLEGNKNLSYLFSDNKKRWRILVPVTKECNEACKNNLYITRQAHIRLAEKAYRVERILLLIDDINTEEIDQLEKEHPETLVKKTTAESLQNWLESVELEQSPQDHYFLIDQNGFVMMRYDNQHSGQDLLDDIKKLLKFTYDK